MNLSLIVKMVTVCMMVVAPATCDFIFDLNAPANYRTFIAQVRNEIKDPRRSYYGLPIAKPPSNDIKKKYLYIKINAKAQGTKPAISVTLQLKTADFYLVAYRDKDDKGKDRAFYFKKLIAAGEVFPGITITKELMKCNHDYESIEGAAGKEIKQLEFRLPNLEDAMRKAYGKKSTAQGDFRRTQALFILYSIEMTSEAARFKYIEQKTVKQLPSDVEVASLVNRWDKLSEQIVGSKAGIFQKPIDIEVAEKPTMKTWWVKNVNEIKPDIGILKYIKPNIAVQ